MALMIELVCKYIEEHIHEFPDDWEFGGADLSDPRADARFDTTVYTYYTADMQPLHVSCAHICDESALDAFTIVDRWCTRGTPVYLSAKRPNQKAEILPWQYNKSTDTIHPLGG